MSNHDVFTGADGTQAVSDLSWFEVKSASDIHRLVSVGWTSRATAATNVHDQSSRSHCIVSISVTCEYPEANTSTRSTLHFVDLAGSECVADSGVIGDALTESRSINRSLAAFSDVIKPTIPTISKPELSGLACVVHEGVAHTVPQLYTDLLPEGCNWGRLEAAPHHMHLTNAALSHWLVVGYRYLHSGPHTYQHAESSRCLIFGEKSRLIERGAAGRNTLPRATSTPRRSVRPDHPPHQSPYTPRK